MSLFDTLSSILQDGPFSLPTNGQKVTLGGMPMTLPVNLSGTVRLADGKIYVTLDAPVKVEVIIARARVTVSISKFELEPGDVMAAHWGFVTKRFQLTEVAA